MSLPYPQNTIWYVEASDWGGSPTAGSAVAVRLQKKGEADTAKIYLLTCAHVIRGKSQDGKDGYGPPLPQIRAWPPGSKYGEHPGCKVRIADNLRELTPGDVPSSNPADVASDWVVLEFLEQTQDSIPGAFVWVTACQGHSYQVVGFPGGKNSFFQDKSVVPTQCPGKFTYREETDGTLTLVGVNTQAGVSGGGVFEEGWRGFVGIHRSRAGPQLQLLLVSASAVKVELSQSGYELAGPLTIPTFDPTWHPLANGHPPEWASSWGEDHLGVWAALAVDTVRARLR